MKRVIIAGMIMVALWVFNNYSLSLLDSRGQDILEQIKSIEEQIDSGQSQNLQSACTQLREDWITTERVWSRLVRRDELDDITSAMARLPALAQWEEQAELQAGLEQVEVLILDVLAFETPSLTGFL